MASVDGRDVSNAIDIFRAWIPVMRSDKQPRITASLISWQKLA